MKNQVTNKTRRNTLVKFNFEDLPVEYHSQYPFCKEDIFLFLGEIKKMDGHCVVATKDGRVIWGYHTDNFIVLSDDEI